MAEQHPYASSQSGIVNALEHLKKSFPSKLNSEVLKKLGIAPKNESYIINTLRFLGIVDENDKTSEEAKKTFTIHDPTLFQESFSEIVKSAYSELFELYREKTWDLSDNELITFFRQSDHSSELVGTRQANTFRTLATFAGHGEPLKVATSKPRTAAKGKAIKANVVQNSQLDKNLPLMQERNNLGLTVRIEINLPAQGDQETYDKIFKSIRENLLNG